MGEKYAKRKTDTLDPMYAYSSKVNKYLNPVSNFEIVQGAKFNWWTSKNKNQDKDTGVCPL
jgi:hypothetical protein